jgi:ParB-like chromosome segregation protein Spo0J
MTQPLQPLRVRIPISSIDASGRIRADYSHLDELTESISREGLIQPIVVTIDNKLVAGGSRLRAAQALGWTEIDVTYLEALSEDRLRILEVEENIRRKDFDWRERVQAVARIHELTGRQKILSKEATQWTQRQTGELLGVSVGHVSYCVTLAARLAAKDAEIEECLSLSEAMKVLLERKEKEANKLLALATMNGARALLPSTPTTDDELFSEAPPRSGGAAFVGGEGIGLKPALYLPGAKAPAIVASTLEVILTDFNKLEESVFLQNAVGAVCNAGDCLAFMSGRAAESIDHIITDIPYGIDMGNLQQSGTGMDVSSVAAEHDVDENWDLMRAFVPAAFRVLRENSYCILWYDLDMHDELRLTAETAGFKVQRWPLVWVKTSSCLNQSAQYNFTKSCETAMVLRKGNATLVTPQSVSWWMGPRETRFDHAFAKPVKLWQWLMNAVALKGQTIYDPFAGVGSSTLAALEAGFKPLASELNENHFSKLVENVRTFYQSALCLQTPTTASSASETNSKST